MACALESRSAADPRDAAALIDTAKEYGADFFEDLYVTKLLVSRCDDHLAPQCLPSVSEPLWLTWSGSIEPFISRFRDSKFLNALAAEVLSFSPSPACDEELVMRFVPNVLCPAALEFESSLILPPLKTLQLVAAILIRRGPTAAVQRRRPSVTQVSLPIGTVGSTICTRPRLSRSWTDCRRSFRTYPATNSTDFSFHS